MLNMLSSKMPALERHFFKELALEVELHKTGSDYLFSILELMQNNLPVVNQDLEVFHYIGKLFQQAATNNELQSAKVYTTAKELYLRI